MDAVSYTAWVLKPTSSIKNDPSASEEGQGGDKDDGAEERARNSTKLSQAARADSTQSSKGEEGMQVEEGGKLGEDMDQQQSYGTIEVDKLPLEQLESNGTLLFIEEDEEEEEEETKDAEKEQIGEKTARPTTEEEKGPAGAAKTSLPKTTFGSVMAAEIKLPLLDYLCALNECSLKELQVLFLGLQARQRMVNHLQQHCRLRTAHLRPPERNIWLQCHDLSAQNANRTFACGGYLDLTVRQYYYAKHGLKLKHPYLPCLIQFGGGSHASYYPLEVIHVLIEQQSLVQSQQQQCPLVRRLRRALSPFPGNITEEEGPSSTGSKQLFVTPPTASKVVTVEPTVMETTSGRPASLQRHCCCCTAATGFVPSPPFHHQQ